MADDESQRGTCVWSDAEFDAIVQAGIEGEGWAFEKLFGWLAPQLTAFAAARRADDAEGITNETFLRAFANLHQFRGSPSSFRSWMFTIARNQLIDAHRASIRRPQIVSDEVPEELVGGAEDAAFEAFGAERISGMVACLSSDQRDVILLRLVADLSLKQVAEILDKPVGAVKALQRRGLQRLQSELLSEVVTP